MSFQCFLVRQASSSSISATSSYDSNAPLALSMVIPSGAVLHYLILQLESGKKSSSLPPRIRLESSPKAFDNILSLVYHYSKERFVSVSCLSCQQFALLTVKFYKGKLSKKKLLLFQRDRKFNFDFHFISTSSSSLL